MRLFLIIAICLWGSLASAHDLPAPKVESYDVTRLAVTVYPDDLAMITEVRTIDIPAGQSEIRFHGVSDMILPETSVLQSFEGLRLEGNFDSDVISRNALLQKAVGSMITIRRLDPATGESKFIEAELISATPGITGTEEAVFKTEDGLEALYCSGLSESVLFSKIPETLNPIPILSMLVNAEEAGPKEITLTYLTKGLGWAADYRMDVIEGEDTASLLGWLTLSNKTSKAFKDAELAVVAGEINRILPPKNNGDVRHETRRVSHAVCGDGTVSGYKTVMQTIRVQYASAPMGFSGGGDEVMVTASRMKTSVREATREDLGDYKLYRAPQSVTLSPHQTKQIAFLLKPDVEFETVHKRTIDLERVLVASQHYAIASLNLKSIMMRVEIWPASAQGNRAGHVRTPRWPCCFHRRR